mgnify:CR=1 FL=1
MLPGGCQRVGIILNTRCISHRCTLTEIIVGEGNLRLAEGGLKNDTDNRRRLALFSDVCRIASLMKVSLTHLHHHHHALHHHNTRELI